MRKSIGKQSGESAESVLIWSVLSVHERMRHLCLF